MRLVFGVEDVRAFKFAREEDALRFGVIHQADGEECSNAKERADNSIQISSRGLRRERG